MSKQKTDPVQAYLSATGKPLGTLFMEAKRAQVREETDDVKAEPDTQSVMTDVTYYNRTQRIPDYVRPFISRYFATAQANSPKPAMIRAAPVRMQQAATFRH